MSRLRFAAWSCLVLVAFMTAPILPRIFRPELIVPELRNAGFVSANLDWLLAQAAATVLALLMGPWQLSRTRSQPKDVISVLAWTYALAVWVASTSGIRLAVISFGGLPARVAFLMLALAWLITTGMAIQAMVRDDSAAQADWMVRSYSLAIAAVTMRLWLPLFMGPFKVAFNDAYVTAAWLSWVPNLILAEIVVSRRRPQPKLPVETFATDSGVAKIIVRMRS
jgi:hypothetical protein